MTEQNKEHVEEQVLELDAEQLEEYMSDIEIPDKLPPIVLSVEDYDQSEFQRGIDEMSYSAGMITALLNCGVSESFVLDFLLSKDTIAHNIKAAEISKDMHVEVAKTTKGTNDKFEL